MKCATTSLHEYLSHHPRVFVSEPKELDFFSLDSQWDKGSHWYSTFFQAADDESTVGEISPSYAMAHRYPGVPDRIAGLLPKVRIVYLVRHPLERMRSMYVHHVFDGRERRTISTAFREDTHYLDTSRYAWQLEGYLRRFPREQLLVVSSEQLRADRPRTLARVLRFLGAEPADALADLVVESHPTAPKQVPRFERSRQRGWVERPRWPPDRRDRLTQRLTTRPLRPADLALDTALEHGIWSALEDDIAALRQIVGDAEFNSWGWSRS